MRVEFVVSLADYADEHLSAVVNALSIEQFVWHSSLLITVYKNYTTF